MDWLEFAVSGDVIGVLALLAWRHLLDERLIGLNLVEGVLFSLHGQNFLLVVVDKLVVGRFAAYARLRLAKTVRFRGGGGEGAGGGGDGLFAVRVLTLRWAVVTTPGYT